MAKDSNGQIIDPYHGQQDLANRTLRHVSAAFSEDPLRIFRVARFAARYHLVGFTVAPETEQLMQQMAATGMLSELTAERVWQETRRAVLDQGRGSVLVRAQPATHPLSGCGLLSPWRWCSTGGSPFIWLRLRGLASREGLVQWGGLHLSESTIHSHSQGAIEVSVQ